LGEKDKKSWGGWGPPYTLPSGGLDPPRFLLKADC
jgi:hypothetical protein